METTTTDMRAKLAAAFPKIEAVLAAMREQDVTFTDLSAYLSLHDALDFYDDDDGDVDILDSIRGWMACDIEDAGENAEYVTDVAISQLAAAGFELGDRPL